MISLPVVLTYKDISVYPDTNNCNLYYCLRSVPQVRMSENGIPVFRGTFWSGAKASDETVAGLMGGRINFDTNLMVSESEQEILIDLIKARGIQQKRYNEIFAREKKHANLINTITAPSDLEFVDQKVNPKKNPMTGFIEGEMEAARSRIPEVGEVSFGTVQFTTGTVDVFEQNGGSLVEWHNGGGKPAMFGDNNRATVLQLTPLGAGVFYKGIMGRTQAISLVYDMTLPMAMPALDIRIYAGSVQAASIERHVDKGCAGKVNSRKITELLTDMGFIQIEIDRKSSSIDEGTINNIRESMMQILEKKVEEIINTKIMTLSAEEREKDTTMIIEQEFRNFTELNFSETSVFEYNIAPQATICEFFENVTDEQLKKMVTTIDLTDEVFSRKNITLCALAPWNEKPFVERVKVECEYPSLPADNKDRIRSFSFDKDHPTDEWSFLRPKNDDGIIKYTPTVWIGGKEVKLPTETAKGNYVVVGVGKIGIIDIGFGANPNVANLPGDLKVSGIQVELWYDDAQGNRLMGPNQIMINDLAEVKRFEANLGVVIDQPIHYKTTYYFKTIDPITLPEKTFYLADDGVSTILLEFPFKNRKAIRVELPMVPDDSVKDINGEIYYGKYTFPIDLSKEDDWEAVKVNLCTINETLKDYSYSFTLKYENSEYDMVKSAVMKGDTNTSTLIVPLKRVEMAGIDMLDLGEKYYRANVQITMPGCNPIDLHLSRKDKDLESKIFYLFCPDDQKLDISWSLTLYDMEGKELPTVTGKTDKTFFIITPPKEKNKK